MPALALTSKQLRHLRALAHPLEPTVVVGKDGVTDGVIAATRRELRAHELIKVRVLESSPLDRREVGPALADATGAACAGTIGRIAILYAPHPEKPTIRLPRAKPDA